jgi:hypothetical protein
MVFRSKRRSTFSAFSRIEEQVIGGFQQRNTIDFREYHQPRQTQKDPSKEP